VTSDWTIHDRFEPNLIRPDEMAVFAGGSSEDRGRISLWDDVQNHRPTRCISITTPPPTVPSDLLQATFTCGKIARTVHLRSTSAIVEITKGRGLFLDISGLPHHVWAPLLRAGISSGVSVRAMYVEPERYRHHSSPSSNSMFDLSTGNLGLSPLPGFASISSNHDPRQQVFVPMLGFEGTRALYLSQQLDPSPPHTIPIVGVPGFRPEYPTTTIACNLDFLDEFDAYSHIRMAPANDMFTIVKILDTLRKEFPSFRLLVAPVGTKPHALGAVVYAIREFSHVELMYDNPIRRPQRTFGVGKVHIYTIS